MRLLKRRGFIPRLHGVASPQGCSLTRHVTVISSVILTHLMTILDGTCIHVKGHSAGQSNLRKQIKMQCNIQFFQE